MNASEEKIIQLESTVHALEELLAVSEASFLKESKKLEEANELLRRENTYRLFFEASPKAMLTLYDNRFIYCNKSTVKMLRAKSREEVLNTHPWDLSPEYQPDGRLSSEKAEEMIATALKQGAHSFEWDHRRMDGEVFPVAVELTSIAVEGKMMFNVSWEDITEKKQAEKELDEYHHHLEDLVKSKTEEITIELEKHKRLENDIEQILDASSDAIRVIDKDYNIVYTSRSFNLLHGHPENIIGKKCYDVVPEKECHTKDCSLKRVLKSGKKFSIEREIDTLDGTKKLYHVDIIPYNDSNGKFLGIIKNYRDITEERQAEERLAEEIREREILAEKYRILFETSADAIMLFDEKGFFDCNKATLELFGFSKRKEFMKTHPGDISVPIQPDGQDSFSAADKHIEKAFREGSDFFEWIHKRQDGTSFPAEVLLSRMEYQGKTVVQATVRDITERKQAEERLAELSEEYRILFESSADAIMLHTQEKLIDCNEASLKLFGFSSKEELAKHLPVDLSPEKQPDGQESLTASIEHMEKAVHEGTEFFEWVLMRKDGTLFPAEVLLNRMEYRGDIVLQATIRDITERKQAEERLAEEIIERETLAEKYRILFETSGDAIMLNDEKGFFDCNKATLELFGYPKKEFLKLNPIDITTAVQENGEVSLKSAKIHAEKAIREGSDCFEWNAVRKDGSVFPCEVMLSRMEYQGRTVLLAVVRNIAERKQAEENFRHISAIQKLILENSTLGIGLVRNRIFEWVNPRVGELLMMPIEKIQGASTRVIYPSEESYQELGRVAYPMLVDGGRSDTTLQLKRSDGSLFWCRFIGKALDSTKIQDGSIWMFEDITEEKEAQRIAEENAQQQGRIEMANNMLHDIGNAMTGISTYVLKPQMEKVWQEIQSLYQLRDLFMNNEEKLIKVFGKEKQQALNDFMKALVTSCERRQAKHLEFSEKISSAVGHVCSVLDLQRHYLRENTSPLATKISLPTLISDTLVMLSGSLKKRNIKVSFDVKGKKNNISGDQTRLMRVFLNVIKNSCEAFDEMDSIEEGRMLEINISSDEDKEKIKIVFSDNGIGFTPEDGRKIFERGFTSKINGSGIGLHECRSIIESHDGTIDMTSKGINTGASTIITFPILKYKEGVL